MSQVNAAIADPASVDAAIENRFSARALAVTLFRMTTSKR